MKKNPNLDFTLRLLAVRDEAMRLGLYVTVRALDNVVKTTGWEQAGNITKAASYAPSFEVESA